MDKKNVEERVKDCVVIRGKLRELGLEGTLNLGPLFLEMNEFVRDGQTRSGAIPMPEIERVLVYELKSKVGRESYVVLKRSGFSRLKR